MKVNVKQMTVDTSVIQRERTCGTPPDDTKPTPTPTPDPTPPVSESSGMTGLEELFEQYELRKRY